MKAKSATVFLLVVSFLAFVPLLRAQDLGPHFKKIADGIYVEATSEPSSTCSIILTKAGVVLIDTEPHTDHTTNHWAFSPPAVIIAGEGATDSMKKAFAAPDFASRIDMPRAALTNYQLVTPQVEYHDKMTLHVGERTFELMRLNNVHSEADTAIWLPSERVLFAASAAVPKSLDNIRSFVTIQDKINAFKMMEALNPEIVVTGHGSPGTVKTFDETTQYYTLLIERVKKMVQEGKSEDQIKQELRMPEYSSWIGQDRMPTNIDAAYRAVKAGYSPGD